MDDLARGDVAFEPDGMAEGGAEIVVVHEDVDEGVEHHAEAVIRLIELAFSFNNKFTFKLL